MKITQTLELSEEERNAIAATIGICEELSDKTHRQVIDVFEFLYSLAEDRHNYMLEDSEIDLSDMD